MLSMGIYIRKYVISSKGVKFHILLKLSWKVKGVPSCSALVLLIYTVPLLYRTMGRMQQVDFPFVVVSDKYMVSDLVFMCYGRVVTTKCTLALALGFNTYLY